MEAPVDAIARNEKQLAAALRRYRRQASLTQEDLADRTHRRQATISSFESGEGGTLDTLFALLGALELELVVRRRGAAAPPALEDIF